MLELSPEETPHINFQVNGSALRDTIRKFGRVDSKPNMDGVFVRPGAAAPVSLPRSFEEYGDDEHHVLYKSVKKDNSVSRYYATCSLLTKSGMNRFISCTNTYLKILEFCQTC